MTAAPRAAHSFAISVRDGAPANPTMWRMMLGPLHRPAARYEVLVTDRTSGATVLRIPVDQSRHEAHALAELLRVDLDALDESAFLKRHGRMHRRAPRF